MIKSELNELFRDFVKRMKMFGFKPTTIGKMMFGLSAYSQVQKFTKGLDDGEDPIEFGYIPLSKIGRLLQYDLHLVYVQNSDNEFIADLAARNEEFGAELEVKMKNYLANSVKEKTVLTDKEKISNAVDEILDML